MKELGFEFVVGGVGVGEIGEESFLVIGTRDAKGIEAEGFGDGGIDDQGGEDGACGLIVEVIVLNAFGLGDSGDVRSELAEDVVARLGLVRFGEVGGEHLDFGPNHDEVFDSLIAEVVVNLGDQSGNLFPNEADDGFAGEVGGLQAFPATVGSETVGLVADNPPLFGEDEAGVSGSDVGDDGVALLHRRGVAETAPGLQENEAGHLAIVERLKVPLAGDVETVEEDLGVGCFFERVGGDGADGDVAEAEFSERCLKAPDDGDGLLDGGGADFAIAENVPPKRDVFLQKVDPFLGAVLGDAQDDHGSVACSDVNGGAEHFGGGIGHGDKGNRPERDLVRQLGNDDVFERRLRRLDFLTFFLHLRAQRGFMGNAR